MNCNGILFLGFFWSVFISSAFSQCEYPGHKTFADSIFSLNDRVICPTINYAEPGSFRILTETSTGKLRDIAQFILDLSSAKFELLVYTDIRGNEDLNLLVSQRRADEVKKYLISNFPIEPERIIAKGLGELDPVFNLQDFNFEVNQEKLDFMHNCNSRTVLFILHTGFR